MAKLNPMNYRYDLLQWRRAATEKGYEEVAKAAGLSVNGTWKLINGKTKSPGALTIIAISKALSLNPNYVLDKRLRKPDFHLAVL